MNSLYALLCWNWDSLFLILTQFLSFVVSQIDHSTLRWTVVKRNLLTFSKECRKTGFGNFVNTIEYAFQLCR